MSIQKFPLPAIQKVRQYIINTLTLPNSEQKAKFAEATGELPEPASLDDLSDLFSMGGVTRSGISAIADPQEKWFISTVNPGAALLKLPGLWLKPDYRLVSYLYRRENSGVGLVWAVPETLSSTAQLEKAMENCCGITQLPKPEGALLQLMEAVDGDRSPASYLIASILRRELQEFGNLGDRRHWGHHHLIDELPADKWQWRTEKPQDWSPKVKLFPDGKAAVEFFTCCTSGSRVLYRHLDQYPEGQYRANSIDKSLAIAA